MDRPSALALPTPVPEFDVRREVSSDVKQAFALLAIAVGHGLEPEQEAVYAFALRDVAAGLLGRACEALARTAKWWPKPVEIRQQADALRRQDAEDDAARVRAHALPPRDLDGPLVKCRQCSDESNGWIVLRCPAVKCERHETHQPHTFSVRCPHWLREHESTIQLAEEQRREKAKTNYRASAAFNAMVDLSRGQYRYERAGL